MGLCVSIDIHRKKILVVGGGLTALRKVKLLLSEGASIDVIAPVFDHAFMSLPCRCIVKTFRDEDVFGYWMVIAASGSSSINAHIVQIAKQSGILCMSIHHTSDADVHALLYKETENFEIALSTKQAYPAMDRVALTAMENDIEQIFKARMRLLKPLRIQILGNDRITDKHERLRALATADLRLLTFIDHAIRNKSCLLLCFHGVKQAQALAEIYDFIQNMQPHMQDQAIGFAFLSKHLHTTDNPASRWYDFSDLLTFFKAFRIRMTLYPMLLQKGYYYQQIRDHETNGVTVSEPPFSALDDVRDLLNACQADSNEHEKTVCIYHSSKTGELSAMLHTLQPDYPNILFLNRDQQNPDIPFFHKSVIVFSLYMLPGLHMLQDQDEHSMIVSKLKRQQCVMNQHHQACITHPRIQALLIKKICEAYTEANRG